MRQAERVWSHLAGHPGRGGCGVGAIADPNGASRELIDLALAALGCLEHRGGAIGDTGDGAGLLFSVDREFFSRFVAHGRHLPDGDALGVAEIYFPQGESANAPPLQARIDALLRVHGLAPLGWRRVPVDPNALGAQARASMREPWQLLVGQGMLPEADLPRAYFRVKAEIERQLPSIYCASFAPGTVVYKALATGPQLRGYYADLSDPALKTDLVVLHRRYSTNTLSNWALAQPFRLLAHNGEINTIKANRSAIASMERELSLSGLLMQLGSDSADLDRAVELFTSHGVSLPETLLRLMPAAWRELVASDSPEARFSRGVQRALGTIAAWEGPAGVVATDGEVLVAALDRMGLRPLRWVRTTSGRLIVSSELGSVPLAFDEIAETGQLDPGEAIAFWPRTNRFARPAELRAQVALGTRLNTDELAEREIRTPPPPGSDGAGPVPEEHLALFGWTPDRTRTVRYMAAEAKEPVVGMGYDRPLAVFSRSRPPLFRYFKQIVAVVTNPPIDPIREGGAFDMTVHLGPVPTAHENLPVYDPHPQWRLASPVLTPGQLAAIRDSKEEPRSMVLDATCDRPAMARTMSARLSEMGRAAVRAVRQGTASILIVSDRAAVDGSDRLPLPMLLAVAAVHNALSHEGLRRACSIVAECGEAQEGHDICVLLANGATAVCPWLMVQVAAGGAPSDPPPKDAVARLVKALDGAVRRVMSKMGICSVDGYRGARLVEAVGLAPELVDYYLPGVASRVGGVTLQDLADDLNGRARDHLMRRFEDQGIYRREVWEELQHVAKGADPEAWDRFIGAVESTPSVYLRDLLRLRDDPACRIPLESVEPSKNIVQKHLRGAALSHGALHRTAHRAIAAAFNELGGMSNCGERGEARARNRAGEQEHCRSRIRQVASARFGVDATYLVNADELEIKIGQGAKPGEGGQLPGEKVTAEIAAIRRTPQGVALISPPPHHDIYSIEDLAQLVASLRRVNPRARIGVKCPAVTELGTIAVGVAKAGADVISISGFEGGTGAATQSSVEHAGLPLELGLTDAHQALVANGIRQLVKLRVDGGIKTGADVVKVVALGADEVSLGTALLIAEQCIYCHGCSKGNCPAGITTSNSEVARRLMQPKTAVVRAELATMVEVDPIGAEEERFLDAKNGVQRYLLRLGEDVRRYLAALGKRELSQLVGRVDLLEQVESVEARANTVDLSGLLADLSAYAPARATIAAAACVPGLVDEDELIAAARMTRRLAYAGPFSTGDRAVGARLSGALAEKSLTLDGPARLEFIGYAGQGFGFALVDGLELRLAGFAQDTVGEVMSGGRIVIVPPRPADSAVGNAAAYGATGGELFVAGRTGQRLGVRNSGATIVCEGAGKYAFEYMTGGLGVVLGPVARVVGSGFTGGELFLLDTGTLDDKLHADARWAPAGADARDRLLEVLRRYADATGSAIARALLAEPDALVSRMRRAVPAA
jgi:glutamate synthase (ferredoxin)